MKLGMMLGVRRISICKTCGSVMDHAYRCFKCEEKAKRDLQCKEIKIVDKFATARI